MASTSEGLNVLLFFESLLLVIWLDWFIVLASEIF